MARLPSRWCDSATRNGIGASHASTIYHRSRHDARLRMRYRLAVVPQRRSIDFQSTRVREQSVPATAAADDRMMFFTRCTVSSLATLLVRRQDYCARRVDLLLGSKPTVDSTFEMFFFTEWNVWFSSQILHKISASPELNHIIYILNLQKVDY